MTENIELGIDELDREKIRKLEASIGEDAVQQTLEQQLTQIIRQLYDNKDQLEQRMQEQQTRQDTAEEEP